MAIVRLILMFIPFLIVFYHLAPLRTVLGEEPMPYVAPAAVVISTNTTEPGLYQYANELVSSHFCVSFLLKHC
jgi:hypothetical protein